MKITIRKEENRDYDSVRTLLIKAFEPMEESDNSECDLVERLRKREGFVPELSLVAEADGTVAGYILLTEISVQGDKGRYLSLALAPVAVLPDFQKKGIGKALILRSHEIAAERGYSSIILLGHKEYYPRFGYEPTVKYNITSPFDVPPEFFMIHFLDEDAKGEIEGKVVYPEEFFE